MTEHTIDDLRVVAEFARIDTDLMDMAHFGFVSPLTDRQLEDLLLSDSGMAAVLRAFLKAGIMICLRPTNLGLGVNCKAESVLILGEPDATMYMILPETKDNIQDAVFSAAVQYVKVRRMK